MVNCSKFIDEDMFSREKSRLAFFFLLKKKSVVGSPPIIFNSFNVWQTLVPLIVGHEYIVMYMWGEFTVNWGVYVTLQYGILQNWYDYYMQTSGFIKFVWSVGTKLSLILLPKCGFICPPKNYPSNLISTDALPAETTRPHGPLLAKARSVLAIIDGFGWVSGLGC